MFGSNLKTPRPSVPGRISPATVSPIYGEYLLVRGFDGKPCPIFRHWAGLDLWRKDGCPRLKGMR